MDELSRILKKRKSIDEIKKRQEEMMQDFSESYEEKLPNYSEKQEDLAEKMPYIEKEKNEGYFSKLKKKLRRE